jgi:hypothetical protein
MKFWGYTCDKFNTAVISNNEYYEQNASMDNIIYISCCSHHTD